MLLLLILLKMLANLSIAQGNNICQYIFLQNSSAFFIKFVVEIAIFVVLHFMRNYLVCY